MKKAEIRRILLAEDDDNDAELTLDALKSLRIANEVVRVTDGAEALDYLCRRNAYAERVDPQPALVLLDLKMPKVDGLEVLQTVKADPQLRMIPVVVLTSSREERDLTQSYGMGVNAYVVKPVEFGQFIDALRVLGAFWAVVNEPPVGTHAGGAE